MTTEDVYRLIDAARLHAELSVQDLWTHYLGIGGTGDTFDIDGYLQGLMPLEALEEEILAQAVNDALIDLHDCYRIPAAESVYDAHQETRLRALVNRLLDQPAAAEFVRDREV